MATLKKYWTIAAVSLSDDFAYRLNFILWRLRLFLQILVSLFLWQAVFDLKEDIFDYSRAQMLTYLLLSHLFRPLILAARSVDVAEVIASGDLTNLLAKPVSLFRYYFVRDLENKGLNLIFASLEFLFLLLFLSGFFRPSFSVAHFFLFLAAAILAVLLFFFLNLSLGFLAFWVPENAWAPRFLFFVFFDFFSGALFPLDVFSGRGGALLRLTPFYYLVFFPLGVLLGRFSFPQIGWGFLLAASWLLIFLRLSRYLWYRGLRVYGAWGR